MFLFYGQFQIPLFIFKSTIYNNWACYTKINTIALFSIFSQEILTLLVKNSDQGAQIFCLTIRGGEVLFALKLVHGVGSIYTLRLGLQDEARSKGDKNLNVLLYPWH